MFRAKYAAWTVKNAEKAAVASKLSRKAAKIRAKTKAKEPPGFFDSWRQSRLENSAKAKAAKDAADAGVGFGTRVGAIATHHKVATAATVTGIAGAGILAGRASKQK